MINFFICGWLQLVLSRGTIGNCNKPSLVYVLDFTFGTSRLWLTLNQSCLLNSPVALKNSCFRLCIILIFRLLVLVVAWFIETLFFLLIASCLKTINSKKYGVDLVCFTSHPTTVIYSSKNGWDGMLIPKMFVCAWFI